MPIPEGPPKRNARQFLHINYTILLGADSSAGPRPARSQFLVDSFPRLVLIDGNGDIPLRSSAEGMSERAFAEPDWEIDHCAARDSPMSVPFTHITFWDRKRRRNSTRHRAKHRRCCGLGRGRGTIFS